MIRPEVRPLRTRSPSICGRAAPGRRCSPRSQPNMATIAAALIGAGVAYYGSRQANKRSRQEREAAEWMRENGMVAGDYGKDALARSKRALDPVYDYYSKLASGDRASAMQYLKPEIEATTAGSRRAFQTSS